MKKMTLSIGFNEAHSNPCPYRMMTNVNPKTFLHYENAFFDLIDEFIKDLESEAGIKELTEKEKKEVIRIEGKHKIVKVKCPRCGRERLTYGSKSCECWSCRKIIDIKKYAKRDNKKKKSKMKNDFQDSLSILKKGDRR